MLPFIEDQPETSFSEDHHRKHTLVLNAGDFCFISYPALSLSSQKRELWRWGERGGGAREAASGWRDRYEGESKMEEREKWGEGRSGREDRTENQKEKKKSMYVSEDNEY